MKQAMEDGLFKTNKTTEWTLMIVRCVKTVKNRQFQSFLWNIENHLKKSYLLKFEIGQSVGMGINAERKK